MSCYEGSRDAAPRSYRTNISALFQAIYTVVVYLYISHDVSYVKNRWNLGHCIESGDNL